MDYKIVGYKCPYCGRRIGSFELLKDWICSGRGRKFLFDCPNCLHTIDVNIELRFNLKQWEYDYAEESC